MTMIDNDDGNCIGAIEQKRAGSNVKAAGRW
jgi:hypothetical protein